MVWRGEPIRVQKLKSVCAYASEEQPGPNDSMNVFIFMC